MASISLSLASSTNAAAVTETAPVRRSGLTVNAAFLKEIKDDNRHLKSLWDKTLPLVSHVETARNHWQEIVGLLSELRDQLAMHFSLEEAYGYFDEAVDIAPRLSLTAESLRSSHPKLFAQIRDLADSALDVNLDRAERVEAFLSKFFEFRLDFEHHEEAELKLILQSFDDDLGVGD